MRHQWMVVGKDSSGQFEWLSPGTVSPSHHTVLMTLQFSSPEASSIVIVTVFLDMIICRHTPILSLIFKHFRFWLITVMFEGTSHFPSSELCFAMVLSCLTWAGCDRKYWVFSAWVMLLLTPEITEKFVATIIQHPGSTPRTSLCSSSGSDVSTVHWSV